MAISDYNKEKTCEVTSQNDSGSTISKAQPVKLEGQYKDWDSFDDGDFTSNPTWTKIDSGVAISSKSVDGQSSSVDLRGSSTGGV